MACSLISPRRGSSTANADRFRHQSPWYTNKRTKDQHPASLDPCQVRQEIPHAEGLEISVYRTLKTALNQALIDGQSDRSA